LVERYISLVDRSIEKERSSRGGLSHLVEGEEGVQEGVADVLRRRKVGLGAGSEAAHAKRRAVERARSVLGGRVAAEVALAALRFEASRER
jgi:hypothetical protein